MDSQDVRARIAELSLPETKFQSVELVPAGPYSAAPPGAPTPLIWQLPEHWRVRLIVAPQITIEAWLPADNWNERFQGVGGGGLAGVISYAALAMALQAGYAS